jgi:methyl-accepting chemotaxis protein
MADSNLLYVLIAFVALCALSQLGQALAMLGLYRKVKEIQQQAVPLIGKAEATLESAKSTLEDSRRQIVDISRKANEILDSTKTQLVRVDSLMSEATDRARTQMDKVELVVGDSVDKVQSIVNTTHNGLIKPLREVNALVAGVRGGFGFLFGRQKGPVSGVTQDEEMFI